MAAYGALRHLGSDWYRSVTSLVLKVPSVLVPNEFNYILNTRHPDFERLVKQTGTEDFDWDLRLKG
jgi:RES domain-containing protein